MKYLVAVISAMLIFSNADAIDIQDKISRSRDIVRVFANDLKTALKTALQEKGPVHAIQVCEEKAPAIAHKISEENNLFIGRTSQRYRNSANEPDAWERKVLVQFEKRKSAGEPASNLEYSEIVVKNGKKHFRYMKAIPTGRICLTCHGENVSKEVLNVLDKIYPHDNARGFKEGDIRGAFSVVHSL